MTGNSTPINDRRILPASEVKAEVICAILCREWNDAARDPLLHDAQECQEVGYLGSMRDRMEIAKTNCTSFDIRVRECNVIPRRPRTVMPSHDLPKCIREAISDATFDKNNPLRGYRIAA